MEQPPRIGRRVVKIGGSCLEDPDLCAAMCGWLSDQPAAENFLIVGGGDCIEAMRALSRRFPLDPKEMHWRCVDLLDATWGIAGELFPDWIPIATPAELRLQRDTVPRPANYLVRVKAFYHRSSRDPQPLREGWETTTDSIAAFLARWIGASELVLIKSCPIPTLEPQALAAEGIVDAAFPAALPAGIQFRCCQLVRWTRLVRGDTA